jgi:hypothetical protein
MEVIIALILVRLLHRIFHHYVDERHDFWP